MLENPFVVTTHMGIDEETKKYGSTNTAAVVEVFMLVVKWTIENNYVQLLIAKNAKSENDKTACREIILIIEILFYHLFRIKKSTMIVYIPRSATV